MSVPQRIKAWWHARHVVVGRGVALVGWVWKIANSALVITLVSGIIIAGIARNYAQQDEAAKDLAQRSARLDAALTELQQRLTYLQGADRTWDKRCNYLAASASEWETITGTGNYIPTSPSYRGIHLTVVLTEAQRSSGAWDPNYEAVHGFGIFSTRPPYTALWVRGQLEWLNTYVWKRMLAQSMGQLPLAQGVSASKELEKQLGIPTLDEAHKEAMRAHDNLQKALSDAETRPECIAS